MFPGNPGVTTITVAAVSWMSAPDKLDLLQNSKIIRKHWGNKTTYGSDSIPARK